MSQQFIVLVIICLSIYTKPTSESIQLNNEELDYAAETDPFEMLEMLSDNNLLFGVNESSPINLANLEFMMEKIRSQIKALQEIQLPDELLQHDLMLQYESTCSKRATVKFHTDEPDAHEIDECY